MPRRIVMWRLSIALAMLAAAPATVQADEQFLAALSKLATREMRKQLQEKQLPFKFNSVSGQLRAVEPDPRLQAEVKQFKLGGDLLNATVSAVGRFKLDGQIEHEANFSDLVDVKLALVVEARFVKENDKFFIEPKLNDIDLELTILEVSPENLSGGEQLLANLVSAAFVANKDRIIAEANKRLGKRPL